MIKLIEAPWPDSILNPNRTSHWARKAKAKKLSFNEGFFLGKANRADFEDGDIPLFLTFHAPTKRNYDLDNALASMKSFLDGMAKSWGIDDRRFCPIMVARGGVIKGGKVVIEVTYRGQKNED